MLGDDTRLPIYGRGTAKIRLNGKTILLRNALHVPALRAPLYSLRQHSKQPGCGTFSDSNTGSFILFPHFVLQIDDSTDNLLSYAPLGRITTSRLDYAQPRARNSTTIKPTTSGEGSSSVATSPADDTTVATSESSLHDVKAESSSDEPLHTSNPNLTQHQLKSIHHNINTLPPIRSSNVPSPCENRTSFDSLTIHKIFGFRNFRNLQHLTLASKNASLIHTGELPKSIGDFTTIPNPPKGKLIKKRRKYLDKVHMDIVFGDCVSLGGFRCALLLVDIATRYTWVYGLSSLTSTSIISALESFQSDAAGLPKKFHTDFDTKVIGGQTLKWIKTNKSRILADPARRQSANGLVERTWRTLIEMG